MNDDDLLRYSRHILLPEIGLEGQQRLAAARVLVVGAGGLGSPALLYLAGAGIGHITVVDGDTVDLSNLQRQIAHGMDRLGQPKALSAKAAIAALNPGVQVVPLAERADAARIAELVAGADLVLDCSDNFATRQAVNAACVAQRRPLVWGAAVGLDAQLGAVDPARADAGCYACAFVPGEAPQETRCAVMGVLAPLTGVVGSLQAAEAIRWLAGGASALAGRLLLLDARTLDWQSLRLPRRSGCPVCGAGGA